MPIFEPDLLGPNAPGADDDSHDEEDGDTYHFDPGRISQQEIRNTATVLELDTRC